MLAHIHMIIPATFGFSMMERMSQFEQYGMTFTESQIAMGPETIEGEFDELFAGPPVVLEAIKAEKAGADACLVACMGDPGVQAAREAIRIPIIGPGEAAMHFAAMLGHRFSFLATLERRVPTYIKHARLYGVSGLLASVRPVGIKVADIEREGSGAAQLILEAGRKAVEEDGAAVLILGCLGFPKKLKDELEEQLNVTVIDPLAVSVNLAAAFIRSGLSHSKRTYPTPLAKSITGYGDIRLDL